jgi:hypothetical protein
MEDSWRDSVAVSEVRIVLKDRDGSILAEGDEAVQRSQEAPRKPSPVAADDHYYLTHLPGEGYTGPSRVKTEGEREYRAAMGKFNGWGGSPPPGSRP